MIEQTMQDLTNAIRDLTNVLSGAKVALPQPATMVSSAPTNSPPTSPEIKKQPTPSTPSAPAAAPLSRAQLQDLFLRVGKEKGQDAMIQILMACNAAKFSALGEDQFPRFAQLCQHQLGVH
jgi:hypothetical protein